MITEKIRFLYRAWRYRIRQESAEVRFVRAHLRPGQTAVDIGAHKGAFTYWMLRAVGTTGRVFSFEPQPELSQYLEMVRMMLPAPQLTVVPAAVSQTPGTMTLFRPSACPSPGATLRPPADMTDGESFQVPLVSLEAFFDATPGLPIHFIKCDVEGHELEVFQGASRILREHRPVLLFECERRHHREQSIQPVFDFLATFDYECYFFQRRVLKPLALFRPEDQDRWKSPGYVNNFACVPR